MCTRPIMHTDFVYDEDTAPTSVLVQLLSPGSPWAHSPPWLFAVWSPFWLQI